MAGTWTEVDHLISDLGAIRRVVRQLSMDADVRTALDEAVVRAAEAIDFAIDAPANPDRLLVAADAVGVCAKLIETARSAIHKRARTTHRVETK